VYQDGINTTDKSKCLVELVLQEFNTRIQRDYFYPVLLPLHQRAYLDNRREIKRQCLASAGPCGDDHATLAVFLADNLEHSPHLKGC
jgi:hypothetical protein